MKHGQGQMGGRSALVAAAMMTAATIMVGLPGCGGGSSGADDAAQKPATPAVDPRFATADALVETMNQAAQPPYELSVFGDAMVVEDPSHEPLVRFARAMVNLATFDLVRRETFPGETSPPLEMMAMVSNDVVDSFGPSEITSRSDQRATAQMVGKDGSESEVHLVQMRSDGPWAISSITLERDLIQEGGDMQEFVQMIQSPQMQGILVIGGEIAPGLTAKMKSGVFDSLQALEQAYMQALSDYAAANPEFMEGMMGSMQQNPAFTPPGR